MGWDGSTRGEERREKEGRKEARDLVREREQGERKGQKEARYHDGGRDYIEVVLGILFMKEGKMAVKRKMRLNN